MHQFINGANMNRRVDAHLARTQFGQIMDRAVENNERFVVERRGEPAVVIMSVSAPDIDAEISTYRREKRK